VILDESVAALLLKLIESCGSWVFSYPQIHLQSNVPPHGALSQLAGDRFRSPLSLSSISAIASFSRDDSL
jgi:hypothetical protein